MHAQTTDLQQEFETLSEPAKEKLMNYIKFLRYEDRLEELEEAEDIAFLRSLTPKDYENMASHEEVVAKHKAQYGSLD